MCSLYSSQYKWKLFYASITALLKRKIKALKDILMLFFYLLARSLIFLIVLTLVIIVKIKLLQS